MTNSTQISTLCAVFFFMVTSFAQLSGPVAYKKYNNSYFKLPDGISDKDYLSGTVIIKVKPEYRNLCSQENIDIEHLHEILNELQTSSIKKMFPNHSEPEKKHNKIGQKLADLSLIYNIKYDSDTHIEAAINMLYQTKVLEYACIYVTPDILYTPNDTYVGNQYSLAHVKALEAWDIEKGDTNTIIGISDTGFELSSPEFEDQVKYNYDDPVDGIDNDGDGYIDNYNGWDLAEGDNNPVGSYWYHGNATASSATSKTDNTNGIAGIGFNCKFIPAKVWENSLSVMLGTYESIVYLADMGATIINTSWGSTVSSGQFGQDVIDYATINKDVLVVASAGNSGKDEAYYPAALNYVVNVGGTDSLDLKWTNSTYNTSVDIMAPGCDVYVYVGSGVYQYQNGTSFASPIVAGAAGLLRSHYPSYSALQISALLKSTATNIDTISGTSVCSGTPVTNADYKWKTGAGLLNIYEALIDTTSPGLGLYSYNFTDHADNNYNSGDTVTFYTTLINYLEPTSNLTAKLSTDNTNITLLDSTLSVGVLGTLDTTNNNLQPFRFVISGTASDNETIELHLSFEDGSYSAFENVDLKVNADYLDVLVNNVGLTLTSKGSIGFNDDSFTEGVGIKYNDFLIIFSSSFMIGNASSGVMDNSYYDTISSSPFFDEDLQKLKAIQEVKPSSYADYDYQSMFSDSGASSPLGVVIKANSFAWTDTAYDDFIIMEYEISNPGSDTLQDVFAGIFTDWDMDASFYVYNSSNADTANKIGYCYSNIYYLIGGIHLLTDDDFVCYSVDNDGSNGSISIYDGFSDADKLTSLSTNKYTAGTSGYGTDVSQTVSAGPFDLAPGVTKKVAFAILAGSSLGDLQSAAAAADIKYNLMYNPNAEIEDSAAASCYSSCDGEAEIVTTGGAKPFSYVWNNSDTLSTSSAEELCRGENKVKVYDANGLVDSLTVLIGSPDELIALISDTTHEGVQGDCDGAAKASASGGVTPYTYEWSDSKAQTDSVADSLCSGIYTVYVTDSVGCVDSVNVEISFVTDAKIAALNYGINSYYPNPAVDITTFVVNVPEEGAMSFELYNVLGNKVIQKQFSGSISGNHSFIIDVSSLNHGVYFAQLNLNNNILNTFKVVVE